MGKPETKVFSGQEGNHANLKLVISNYYPSFSDEFTILVDEICHTVKTTGVIPSKGSLVMFIEPGLHKIRIQQAKSLMGFMNKETIQEFELDFEYGKNFLVEYGLNQMNQSSHSIKEVQGPFKDSYTEKKATKNQEQSAGVNLAKKVNKIAWGIGFGIGKIRRTISFKKNKT